MLEVFERIKSLFEEDRLGGDSAGGGVVGLSEGVEVVFNNFWLLVGAEEENLAAHALKISRTYLGEKVGVVLELVLLGMAEGDLDDFVSAEEEPVVKEALLAVLEFVVRDVLEALVLHVLVVDDVGVGKRRNRFLDVLKQLAFRFSSLFLHFGEGHDFRSL